MGMKELADDLRARRERIDPRETRPVIVRALEMARTKRVERPWKKHGVMPV